MNGIISFFKDMGMYFNYITNSKTHLSKSDEVQSNYFNLIYVNGLDKMLFNAFYLLLNRNHRYHENPLVLIRSKVQHPARTMRTKNLDPER